MKHRAILDPDGIYQGHEPVKGGLGPGDVAVPKDCDLAVGQYRWDGTTFVFTGEAVGERMLEMPPVLRAVALGFAAIDKAQPDLLPAETKEFLRWFETTVDNIRPKG